MYPSLRDAVLLFFECRVGIVDWQPHCPYLFCFYCTYYLALLILGSFVTNEIPFQTGLLILLYYTQ